MRTKRRTEIVVETERAILITRRRVRVFAWCAACGAEVETVSAEEAAQVCASLRMIYGWADTYLLHSTESDGVPPRVCLNSLIEQSRRCEQQG